MNSGQSINGKILVWESVANTMKNIARAPISYSSAPMWQRYFPPKKLLMKLFDL
jgi:hypothetical protein